MIKKEYIQPEVKEIKVNIPAVLAANSPTILDQNDFGEGSGEGDGETTVNGIEVEF